MYKKGLIVKEFIHLKVIKNQIFSNISWLISDKIITMGIGLFVTAAIARHFGPEQFGTLNYAIAFVALFTAISTLGLETLTIKALIDKKYSEGSILCTSLFLRILGGIVLTLISIFIISFLEPTNQTIRLIVLIISTSMIFKSCEVIEYWIQARQKMKISSIIRVCVYIFIASLKILVIIYDGSLIHYALLIFLEILIIGVALLIAYLKLREDKSKWHINKSYAKSVLSSSWYLIVSGLMVTIYMRIDQVMLGSMSINKTEVGIYSAAVTIAEMWYFIPLAIITAFKPVIIQQKNINEKKYISSLNKLFRIITLIGLFFGLFITILSKPVILLIYGPEFIEAASVLSISVWAGTFALLGSVRSLWMIIEGVQRYALILMSSGAFINIGLNLIFIPLFGSKGAATTTLISQFIVLLILPLFFTNLKVSTMMILKSFSIKKDDFFKNFSEKD
ncbi:flippase [Planococcus shixiaomingii]|uniref:flippase n=1 Tax=Planococcus shixiaomingii TaxID=3058393 RepID=UPI002625DF63|nr:flippase [Planococcus sp. N022]WKA53999.1 flippase [Planococcus sp. N022]